MDCAGKVPRLEQALVPTFFEEAVESCVNLLLVSGKEKYLFAFFDACNTKFYWLKKCLNYALCVLHTVLHSVQLGAEQEIYMSLGQRHRTTYLLGGPVFISLSLLRFP